VLSVLCVVGICVAVHMCCVCLVCVYVLCIFCVVCLFVCLFVCGKGAPGGGVWLSCVVGCSHLDVCRCRPVLRDSKKAK